MANLDRLRLSMRREKSRFNRGVMASLDDASDPSESSSAGISGTSSPNYMKATTSSSARKGSLQASSGNLQSSSASGSIDNRSSARQDNSASSVNSASKLNKVSVQECSDPAGVNIPVIVKQKKSLKRVPSLKQSKKLSSRKSMKIRAKYSQFQDLGVSQTEMLDFGILGFQGNTEINGGMEIDPESSNVRASHGQDTMVKTEAQPRGILERSRSRKLTRFRSIRSSKARQRPQSRFSGGATELMSHEAEVNAEPHYMKGTSSQELRKISDKTLTRTSSLRPLRILAKIPSLRNKKNKARKRPQATSLPGTSVNRATCSSTLKRTQFTDDIELHLRDRELEGTSSSHVCPYSYCSIHGHRHHAPSQPGKEFISAKRKLFSNQKGEKTTSRSRGETEHHNTSAAESDHLRQIVSAETYAVQEVMNTTTENAPEAEDDGIDFLTTVYAKPRKKWSAERTRSKDAEALHGCTYDQISVGDYEGKLAETQSETSVSEDTQGALNDDWKEKDEIFKQHQDSNIAALSLPSDPLHVSSRNSAVSPGGGLINIFSNKQKYTSMWHLIHQQLLSSEASMNKAQEAIQADEKIGGDGNTSREMSNLDPKSECDKNLNDDVDDQFTAKEKLESHQTAAIKLVQEAVNAILQSDAESYHQQSNPAQGVANIFLREHVSTPTASTEETFRKGGEIDGQETSLASAESKHKMKQIGNNLLLKEQDERKMPERQLSKSLSKLRKMFVTAKFIKTMERLKRINPRRPLYLSADPASENEKVNLRHLSITEKKNTEEWMLDNALRQVISRLDPDQQRRVAQLVEAYETVTPEQEEESSRHHHMKIVRAPGSKLAIPMKSEKKQFVEPEQDISLSHEQEVQQQNGVQALLKSVPEEHCFREAHEYQKIATGDKTPQGLAETNTSYSTLVLPEKSSKSECADSAFDDRGMRDEEHTNTLKVASQFPATDTQVHVTSDMPTIFFNRQKYTSMWNMIYKHVVSSEASINENQGVNVFDEEHGETNSCQETNDKDYYSLDQNEDDDNQSAGCEKPELDQSAAIKLVKEALSAILKRHEQPTHLQSIADHYRAPDNDRNLCNSTTTSCIEENPIEGGKRVENHTYLDIEDNLHHVKNASLPLQQVECGESQAPQKKMSKSLSKLRKAIATTRFIKAMERLTKSSPRKFQNPSSDTTSEKERVYLRHRSMNGRKKGEEWMLDFALRQVISKMDPDQQRRVERLVEAFEKVHPGQKEGTQSHSFKKEAADGTGLNTSTNEAKNRYLKSQQQNSVSIEQVPQKQNNGTLPLTGNASLGISLEEHHDQQVSSAETTTGDVSQEKSLHKHHDQPMSSADDIVLQETHETATSDSTLELSKNGPKLAPVVIKLEELNLGNETRGAIPTGNSVVKPGDNMTTILSDKQKYTSLWRLIHHHVLSNEASTTEKKEVNAVDEDEQVNDSNTCQSIIDPDLNQSTQLKNSKVDEDNQSASFDQSAAINFVKESIDAILVCHEQGSDRKSLQHHGRAANEDGKSCDTNALTSTKQDYGGTREEKQRNPELEEKLQEVDVNSSQIQPQAEANEARESERKMSTSFSKLRKAIATAKFIKAMERLRKINPLKPIYLSPEAASEEEGVYLRHLSINERKNNEEWMLDYALRKVLSNLAPDQQRKVALIVEAFETVHPKQKGIRHATKSEQDPAIKTENMTDEKRILESKRDSSMSNDGDTPPMHKDRLNMLGTVDTSKESKHKTEISSKIPDSKDSNLNIHLQASSKGSPISTPLNISTVRKEEIDADHMHELLQHAKDSEQETETNITKDILCGKQKNTSMWHLIYQHVKSTSDAEAGSKLSERLNDEDQINRCGTSAEIIADADSDDSDASSVTSELTETDATKLVREAINNILENELTSSKETAVSEEGERAAVEENTKKSLSRGYSKLRKLIICNKFIKAMEKTRKFHPQKQNSPALNSDTGAGKVHLKTRAVGERKGMNEWMLDNVLQNVIAGLAPVQQKRVALLVEAFEKVHPDLDERGKGLRCSKAEFLDTTFSEADAKEKEDTVSLTISMFPDGFDLKLNRSTTSTREVTTESVPQEMCKDRTPSLTKEYALNKGNRRSDGPCDITSATSDATRVLSDTCKDPTEIDEANAPCVPLEQTTKSRDEAGALLEQGTSIDEQLVGNTEKASIIAKKPPQPEDLKDEWNYSAHEDRSLEKTTSLWGLILQQVTTDMLEKTETPKGEFEAEAQKDSTKTLERRTDDSAQVSSKTKSCRDMGVQTPTSFEFQESEAIKVVEEAVEEILLLQDQINDTEPMTSSTNLEQGAYSSDNEYVREPSPAATETAGIATLLHSVPTPEEEEMSTKENLPNSYNTFSKVILCKRFVKAMDKMRKLKAMSAQNPSQPPHAEAMGIPSLRQISTGHKTSWKEGMLDNALQQVIGNLTPAKKQRVALLVQAFETVGSQPEATDSWRGRALVS